MGRSYAGILGPLAFLTVVTRGLIGGAGTEGTLQLALLSLFAFAALGYVLGRVASLVVDDSVRGRFSSEMASQESPENEAAPGAA